MDFYNVLQFCILNTIAITNYGMNIQKIWLKTTDEKLISISAEECRYSFLINTIRTFYSIGYSRKLPIPVDFNKNQISLFKKIIHQPALYAQLLEDDLFTALFIAEKLRAPLLYSSLLQAKLPSIICNNIAEKYICRPAILKIMQYEFDRKTSSQMYLKKLTKWDTTTNSQLFGMTRLITLPQVVILMSIKKPSLFNNFIILSPHMPGYDDFVLWNTEEQQFLVNNLSLVILVCKEKSSGEYRPMKIAFSV
jgi:hypothetical protein